jgi:hypothetical protein
MTVNELLVLCLFLRNYIGQLQEEQCTQLLLVKKIKRVVIVMAIVHCRRNSPAGWRKAPA